MAVDAAGNLYIADSGNYRIRRVDASGTITTIAGGGSFSGDGGPAIAAQLARSNGVAVDGAGNVFIGDTHSHRIRRVDASGTITTIAGGGSFSGDGGPSVEAGLNRPRGVAVDGTGNLYIVDTNNHRIHRVDASGTITTIAGTGERGFSEDNVPAVRAQLDRPTGVTLDGAGNLYVADTGNQRIRRVDASGIIATIAGTGEYGDNGDGGPAVQAQLAFPTGVAVDAAGNLYIADSYNHRIRRVDASGTITTIAGTGARGFSGDGGPAVVAQLHEPRGVAVDGSGNLYIADFYNHRVRRVDASGTITTIAGTGARGFSGDGGPAVQAQLAFPTGVAVDAAGNLYIADSYNHRIRRVDLSGTITTIAGAGARGYSGDGGPAVVAQLHEPKGVTVDDAGNLYIADTDNHRIRVLTRPSSLRPPTNLTATAVSPSQINLTWKDNSNNETSFRVQRRVARSTNWVQTATTAANVTMFSNTGLSQATTYHYRVRAFNDTEFSTFSNEAVATTLAPPPTVTGFTPMSGPVGTRVTLTGTHFLGATAVEFNGVNALQFEVVSGTSLQATVPMGATSGPISVVTSGETATSADLFTVTSGVYSRLFVPIVLRSRGRARSFFTSEMTLTNRGSQGADIHYTYTAAIGSGSGTAMDFLGVGQQRVIPDAIAYLTSRGVPIGSGAAGGTLGVEFSDLSSASDAAVTVRVSTPVEEGRAGLAYGGLSAEHLLSGPVWLTGLRQNAMDRSNVAVQNAGKADEGNVILKVTVFSGDPAAPGSFVFPEVSLAPGGFHQYSGLLATAGFENGYVKVERVSGTAAYYTYGVINDQANSDGSFVFPVTESSLAGTTGQTLPVIVETGVFNSELTVTNFSEAARTVNFSFVAEAIEAANNTAVFGLTLEAREQKIIPDIVQELRQQGVAGVGPAGSTFAGALFASVAEGDLSGIVIGARTGSPGGGGQYGLFYTAVPYGSASIDSAWIYGLQQNEENRSNLALVNTGEVDGSESVFNLDIYDGNSGLLINTVSGLRVVARRWFQLNSLLANYAPGTTQGYVQIRKISGNNPFLAYGVINDGAAPGQRSGDGAYVPAQE